MPNRWLRESARTSKNLSEVSDFAERLFWRVITTADDYGRFLAYASIVKAACFPLMDAMKVIKVEQALQELADRDLIVLYQVGDRRYGYFLKWIEDQGEPRSKKSKYPDPPCLHLQTSVNGCEQMSADVSSKQHTRSAPETETGFSSLNSPDSDLKSNGHAESPDGFEVFWRAYPKHEKKKWCREWWDKHKPDDVLLGLMLAKIEQAKQTRKWQDEKGKFIPMPSTWLNGERWEDEYAAALQRKERIPL